MTTPSDGVPIEVVGTWLKSDGTPETGVVSIRPLVAASNSTPEPRTVTMGLISLDLDDTGSIRASLLPSDDPAWFLSGQLPYKVNENLSGSQKSYYVYIVPPAPVDLAMIDHHTRADVDIPVELPVSLRRTGSRA